MTKAWEALLLAKPHKTLL